MFVEPFDFEGIIKHVQLDAVNFRPERWNLFDLFDLFMSIIYTGFEFIGPVWFGTAIPETERQAIRLLQKE
jgi:hypothetical protein